MNAHIRIIPLILLLLAGCAAHETVCVCKCSTEPAWREIPAPVPMPPIFGCPDGGAGLWGCTLITPVSTSRDWTAIDLAVKRAAEETDRELADRERELTHVDICEITPAVACRHGLILTCTKDGWRCVP